MSDYDATPLSRIDAHQHFWRPARGDYRWLRADVPALAPICRDIEPAELAPLLARHGVAKTVLVQAADSTAETDFMLGLAREHAFVAGVVGWVDLTRADAAATLARWAAEPLFKGVRPMLQDLPAADWIATAPHAAAVQALLSHGLRFDALVQPWHLEHLLRFVQRWPDLPVVIDHGAKPQLGAGWSADWADAWRRGIAALAAWPNVCCKLSGLLTEAPAGAGLAELQPVWDTLLERFGPQRLIWGSDWPVLNLAADYGRWVALSESLVGGLSAAEQRAIWHDNAVRFYAL
jgi:L-fuconolactonase